MDWDSAMRHMIVTIVQEQLAPIQRDIKDLQEVSNELVSTLKVTESALKSGSDGLVLLTTRANQHEQRLSKISNDAGDLWQAIGDVEGHPSLRTELQSVDAAFGVLQKRIAALEYVRVPITEIEPQDIDEAIRSRVQPLRDDLDDLESKVKRLDRAVDDRLTALEECAEITSKDLTRVVEIATKDVQARLNALEGQGIPEEPAKAPEPFENICAALEAEYVDYGVSLLAGGASVGHAKAQMHNRHLTHALGALNRAQARMDELAEAMGEAEAA